MVCLGSVGSCTVVASWGGVTSCVDESTTVLSCVVDSSWTVDSSEVVVKTSWVVKTSAVVSVVCKVELDVVEVRVAV